MKKPKKPYMKLFDAEFIRHLEYLGLTRELKYMAKKHAWTMMVSEAVMDELNSYNIPRGWITLIDDGTVCVLKKLPIHEKFELHKMGYGERHTLNSVLCQGGIMDNYTIMTSDKEAQNVIRKFGIRVFDIVGFLIMLNLDGVLSKEDTVRAISRLEESGRSMTDKAKDIIIRDLK